MTNQIVQIIWYFQTNDEDPLTSAEFCEFWYSLTPEEKEYYKNVDLKTGLLPE